MLKKKISVVFIDWDDTLFPTTWINKNNINIKNIKNYKVFIKLDQYIFMLLNQIKKKMPYSNCNKCFKKMDRKLYFFIATNKRFNMYS